MSKPYVIAINSIAGGGKTSLANLIHKVLPKSALFRFDDFDATNLYPRECVSGVCDLFQQLGRIVRKPSEQNSYR